MMTEWIGNEGRMARSARRHERGYTMLAVLIVVMIVSVALAGHAMLTAISSLSLAGSQNRLACREAAIDRLNSPAPASDGGSLNRLEAVEGWSDVVYVDPETGQILPRSDTVPARAVRVARRWRRGADGVGDRVFEVVAEAVDATGRPLDRYRTASIRLSRRVR